MNTAQMHRSTQLLATFVCISGIAGASVRTKVTNSNSQLSRHSANRPMNPRLQERFFEDEDGNGFPDSIPQFEDQEGDNIMDWVDSMIPDWSNFDWENFSLETVDWNSIAWTPEAWDEFLQGLLGENTSNAVDFCPILESAVGIGQSFGIEGKCSCEGSLGNGLSIDCIFKECVESLACGDIGLNFTFDDNTGLVKTTACVDTTVDQYEKICFSYQVTIPDTGDIFDTDQTCDASYGGNACGCTIEGLCLAIDCSAYLPGAKMDTCQYLAFEEADDAASLLPRFPIFNETFDGTFAFESINWTNLDWEHLDWNNFGFDKVNWTNVDWVSTPWGSLFDDGMLQDEICPILTGQVLGMSETFFGGGCTCTGEIESGFNILCSFEQECVTTTPTDGVAIAQMDTAFPQSTICGDVALDLAFNNVGSISGNLCVDFAEDIHPITCIDYAIPIADQESEPKCEATYGEEPCKCSIDDMLCVKVDCSAYEPTAVMDTCQVFALEEESDIQMLVPRFGVPSPAVEDVEKEAIVPEASNDTPGDEPDSVLSQANEVNAEKSTAPSRMSCAAFAVAVTLSIITL